ncbi:MAG: hypothetical protein L3J20_01590 [Flavobacteriaceae bacterium]|nr:hypothetical protein [Flavobacteriaceae bacterium]
MSLKAEVDFAGFIFKATVFIRQMHQIVDGTGKPFGRPTGHLIDLIFESSKDTNEFLAWLVGQSMKEIKIVFSPITGNGKSRTIWLRDAYCIYFKEHFISTTTQAMTTTVTISAGIVDDGGVIHYEHWKVSDIHPPKMVEPTPIPREEKPKIIDFYYTDIDGNRDTKLTYGEKAFLVLRSKKMTGETVDLKLDTKVIDFIYNGKRIKDDIIKDYTIKSNTDKIPVEIISEDNEEL